MHERRLTLSRNCMGSGTMALSPVPKRRRRRWRQRYMNVRSDYVGACVEVCVFIWNNRQSLIRDAQRPSCLRWFRVMYLLIASMRQGLVDANSSNSIRDCPSTRRRVFRAYLDRLRVSRGLPVSLS